MNLQDIATESVRRRGFHDGGNLPRVTSNLYIMEMLLSRCSELGEKARSLRKNGSGGVMPSTAVHTMRNQLLMAQFIRHIEEVGELAEALLHGNMQQIRSEIADDYITVANIASVCGVDIDTAVHDKLVADELRGHLHGEATK